MSKNRSLQARLMDGKVVLSVTPTLETRMKKHWQQFSTRSAKGVSSDDKLQKAIQKTVANRAVAQ